jgi:hypothetical protein
MNRDRVIGIATGYGMDDGGVRVRFLVGSAVVGKRNLGGTHQKFS